jgi:hypothetical protein
VENIRHISGTNITHHIDKFEKICGQMSSCGFIPDQEQKIDWFLASVHERTYEAMLAHCINLMLQNTLTFGQMVKLYTHQCFSKYPQYQVEDLTRESKYSNNSNRVKGKGKRHPQTAVYRRENGRHGQQDKGKGRGSYYKRDYQGDRKHYQESYSGKGKFTQNSTYTKGKGRAKGKGKGKDERNKGKGRGKGSNRHDKGSDSKEENEKLTNNSQQVYLEPPERHGDDETTVMFTMNMNRMVVCKPDKANEQNKGNDQDEDQLDPLSEEEKFKIVTTINKLPDNHNVWGFLNPTQTYFDNEEGYDMELKTNEGIKDFTEWYDNQLQNMAEIKANKTLLEWDEDYLTTEPSKEETSYEEWGSSTEEPTWGRRKEEDHELALKLWEHTPTEQVVPNNLHHSEEEGKDKITHKDKREYQNTNSEKMIRSARDDEVEFKRAIPIAGEDSEDYNSDDIYLSGEDGSEDGEIKEDRSVIPNDEPSKDYNCKDNGSDDEDYNLCQLFAQS